ncbi:aldo/keto reductase, partial [Campylobacter fetus subsp. venerealis]
VNARGLAGAGGTFIDTAPNYSGCAEEIVGSFIAKQRDSLVSGTKFTASIARSELGFLHALFGSNCIRRFALDDQSQRP